MSNPGEYDATPIRSIAQMVEWLSEGAKPEGEWLIGTEHEKFGFYKSDVEHYEGRIPVPPYEPNGIATLLRGLHKQEPDDWSPILDHGNIIGLKGVGANDRASISIEPAGQFELSGAPVTSLHETKQEITGHYRLLKQIADPLGMGFLPVGFHPLARRTDQPFMPKGRYAIMRRYMPKVGTRGLDMMTRTCTVQVNLDFSSESDMRRKIQISLALQPIATALFANSPFYQGKSNGLMSNRAEAWLDTDNDRSGLPNEFFRSDFGFEVYVRWLIDVPMYFIVREGKLVDVAGCSFRRWLEGNPDDALIGYEPTMGDFEDHLTTVFPDVRLKRYVEMRGADAGSLSMMVAQSALWTGLLYHSDSLEEIWDLVTTHPWSAYQDLRARVPYTGIKTSWGMGTVRDLAKKMVDIAYRGLEKRNREDDNGNDESHYLDPLMEITHGGLTQAERWLHQYDTLWERSVRPLFVEAAI